MTRIDKGIFNKFINEVVDTLDEVRSIASMDAERFAADRRARFSLRYSIVVIVEALADLSVAILEKDFNESAESYREAFLKLVNRKVISQETYNSIAKLVSLRNMIVHRYWIVDDSRIYREAKEGGVEAIERFIKEVKRYVEAEDP